MIEFRISWCARPTNFNSPRVFFVEAANKDDAENIARNHIERKFGVSWFNIDDVSETKPIPAGKVKA
jgi:hypothetical protein